MYLRETKTLRELLYTTLQFFMANKALVKTQVLLLE